MDDNQLRKLAGIQTRPAQHVSESSFNRIRQLAGLSALPVKENKDKEEDLDMPADDKEEMSDDVIDNNEMPAGEGGEDELPEIIKDLAAQSAGKSDEELEDLMIQIYQAGIKDGQEKEGKEEKVTEWYRYAQKASPMGADDRAEYNRQKNRSKDPLGNRPAGGLVKHADELKSYLRGKGTSSDERRADRRGLDNYERMYTAKYSGPKGKLPEDVQVDEMWYSPNVRITFVGKDSPENRKIASSFGKIIHKNVGGMWSPICTTYTIVPSMHLTKIKEELNKLKVEATAEYALSSSSRDDSGDWSVSQPKGKSS